MYLYLQEAKNEEMSIFSTGRDSKWRAPALRIGMSTGETDAPETVPLIHIENMDFNDFMHLTDLL